MFAEYYFEIKYTKGIDNIRVDIFSKKVELQGNKNIKGVILKIDENGKIRYNYL